MMETFLTRALVSGRLQHVTTAAPVTKRMARQKIPLTPFQGFIHHNSTMYKVNVKRGWMEDVTWVSTPESYFLSSEKPGRMMFHLNTDSIETG